jgi:protein-disulfide isomerase
MSDDFYHHTLEVAVSPSDHSRGADSSPVTLVLYGDFQCPFTAKLVQVIVKLEERFEGQIRYVFRHFPLFMKHPQAQLAAESAEAAAAQGKFWEMHAYLFMRQWDFGRDKLPTGCKLLGLDYNRLDKEIVEHVHLPHIREDVAGGRLSGVASTPTLFINGIMYGGNDEFEDLVRHIEPLLPPRDEAKATKRSFLGKLFKN